MGNKLRFRTAGKCVNGKTCYPSEIDAKMALSNISQKFMRSKIEKRAYRCEHCHKWHLTSKK